MIFMRIIFIGDFIVQILYCTLCIFIIHISSNSNNSDEIISGIASSLIVVSFTASFVAICQALCIYENIIPARSYETFRRVSANIGQANHLGSLLLMGICSIFYISRVIKNNYLKYLLFVIAVYIGVGISITESRTALVNIIALLVLVFIKKNLFKKNNIIVIFSFAIIIIISIFFWPSLILEYHNPKLTNGITSINTTSSMRLQMWQQIFHAISLKPWFGWGPGNVSLALNSVQHSYAETLPFTYSHNIILDFMVWFGIPVSASLVGFILFWIFYCIKKTKDQESIFFLSIIFIFTTHSMLEYPFAYAYMLLPTMLAIGFLEKKSPIFSISIPKIYAAILLLIFSITFILLAFEYLKIEASINNAKLKSLGFGKEINYPIEWTPLTQLESIKKSISIATTKDMNPQEIEILKITSERFPRFFIQKKYAISLYLNGNSEEYHKQLQIIRLMHGEYKKIEIEKYLNLPGNK